MLKLQCSLSVLALTLVLGGCGEESTTPGTAAVTAGPSATGQSLLLTSQPAGAQQVIAARDQAQDDAEIVVVGRIGGGVDPWIQDMAAFSIVDTSLKACSDIPGDSCPTPWDYCCEASVPKARLLVKFVGDDGKVIATDARELLGVRELQTVYVQGQASRDAAGNLTVLASRIYVAPGTGVPATGATEAGHNHDHGHSHDHATEGASADEPAHEESTPGTTEPAQE